MTSSYNGTSLRLDSNRDKLSAEMKTIPPGLLEEVTRRLVAEFQPEEIILFGSHAWGEPDEDSDIDLMVIVSQSDLRPVQRDARAYLCLSGLAAPIELLVQTRSEVNRYKDVYASLECEVRERGRILYEADKPRISAHLAYQGASRS